MGMMTSWAVRGLHVNSLQKLYVVTRKYRALIGGCYRLGLGTHQSTMTIEHIYLTCQVVRRKDCQLTRRSPLIEFKAITKCRLQGLRKLHPASNIGQRDVFVLLIISLVIQASVLYIKCYNSHAMLDARYASCSCRPIPIFVVKYPEYARSHL